MKRYRISKSIELFLALFVGIGAFCGAGMMFMSPEGGILGMNGLIPFFQVLPFASLLFQNLIFPGIALLTFNGVPNIIAAILILKKKRAGLWLGFFQGLILMAWITIQFVIIPLNPLSVSYFIFGFVQFVSGFIAYVSFRQIEFAATMKPFTPPKGKPSTLFVNFSREGYSAEYTRVLAEKEGGDILFLKTPVPVYNTSGFWNAGRYQLHGWPMDNVAYNARITDYKKVVIVTPVWVFGISAPVRRFLIDRADDLKNVETEYHIFHFTAFSYAYIATRMDEIIGKKARKVTSVCDKWGKVRFEKVIVR